MQARRSLPGPASIAGRASARIPKFTSILDFARRKIGAGDWSTGNRVPSENELSGAFGVSRMTARRALDQLAVDGLIVRRRGAGSFIANRALQASFLQIRNIADEIAESGRAYSSKVLRHRIVSAPSAAAAALGLATRAKVFHSLIVHLADGKQLQLEYRYVRIDAAPGYLEADLARETPNHFLQARYPLTAARQVIGATMPTREQCRALRIRRTEPCLLITRVTSSHQGVVSHARILAPASRYQLSGDLQYSTSQRLALRAGE
jgi:GntR family transcriptional regulator, histidine utilization repressor